MTFPFSSLPSFISATMCLHLPCMDNNLDYDHKTEDFKTVSTCSLTLQSLPSYYRRSSPRRMVRRTSHPVPKSSMDRLSKNQLVKAVKPLEELLLCKTTQCDHPKQETNSLTVFPFDEIVVVPQATTTARYYRFQGQEDVLVRERKEQRQNEPSRESRKQPRDLDLREGNVPLFFGVPTTIISSGSQTMDEESQISCDVVSKASSRSLTPHPSFDGQNKSMIMTANDFHYLYQASRKLEEQDWPSDEEGSPLSEGCEWFEGFLPATSQLVYKKGIACIILNDMDESTSFRETGMPAEDCEVQISKDD